MQAAFLEFVRQLSQDRLPFNEFVFFETPESIGTFTAFAGFLPINANPLKRQGYPSRRALLIGFSNEANRRLPSVLTELSFCWYQTYWPETICFLDFQVDPKHPARRELIYALQAKWGNQSDLSQLLGQILQGLLEKKNPTPS